MGGASRERRLTEWCHVTRCINLLWEVGEGGGHARLRGDFNVTELPVSRELLEPLRVSPQRMEVRKCCSHMEVRKCCTHQDTVV